MENPELALAWREDYSVGNAQLDEDHKNLFRCLAVVEMCLEPSTDEQDVCEVLGSALLALRDYTNYHFAREEQMMKIVGHPEYDEHRASHQRLQAATEKLIGDFFNKPSVEQAEKIYRFLNSWLTNHILKEDMGYKTAVESVPESTNWLGFAEYLLDDQSLEEETDRLSA